ncbi:sterol desaturase family protein [Pseudanabaena sp. FACHB-2040]|uniref:sterol desaturase family protein n=1 Tax=Pseudanabaena sp. FACHB-2040 TaxID=2692859 RepID=UPI0016851BF7|nr:sterol desaturase family protein [Pseudanabaena sp. FACHB-2040]MBD2255949.1 sterol desaturase family protein [Pseudanabaena sp. FACHB-2040]
MDPQQIYQFLETVIQGFFQSLVSQLFVITIAYLVVWRFFASSFKRFRIQSVKRAGPTQIREEIKNSIIVIVGGIVTTPVVLILQQMGYTKIYVDINQYGVGYLILNTLILWLIGDAWFYFAHRLLHHSKVYRYIHAVHHQSLDTTPYTALSFHFLEPLILSGWIYIVIFMFPVSVLAIGINQVVGLFNNIKSHLGYEFYPKFFDRTPLRYLVNSTHHNQHHTQYNGNYGLSLRFWDLVFGTEFDDYDRLVSQVKGRRRSVQIVDNSTYKALKISKIVPETSEATSIYFEPEDKNFYNYLPGQHINLRIKVKGKVYHRIFSLSSSPDVDDFLRITVKKHGVVTNHLATAAKIGDEIQALYPWGNFNVRLNPNQARNYLMIAGGSGITPLYSMIKSILAKEKNSKVTLLYASKRKETVIFSKEIEELTGKFRNFIALDFISDQKRLNEDILAQYLQNHTSPEIYICGPSKLKTSIKAYLKTLGVSKKQIHEEDFADGYVSFLK